MPLPLVPSDLFAPPPHLFKQSFLLNHQDTPLDWRLRQRHGGYLFTPYTLAVKLPLHVRHPVMLSHLGGGGVESLLPLVESSWGHVHLLFCARGPAQVWVDLDLLSQEQINELQLLGHKVGRP